MTRCASLLSIFFVLAFGGLACAEAVPVADNIISGDELALTDGRVLRLADIKAVPEAKEYLQTHVAGQTLSLQNAVPDRYGRIVAIASIDGQAQSIEKDLLSQGLAFIYPAAGDGIDELLAAEHEAFTAHRGYWANHPDIAADEAEKFYGSYGFVTGIVVKAARVKNKVYLNFGPDWHTDFTVQIAAHDLRAFRKEDADPLALQGKKIRVRGWIKRDFGPMITLTDPHQMEILN